VYPQLKEETMDRDQVPSLGGALFGVGYIIAIFGFFVMFDYYVLHPSVSFLYHLFFR
jgi:hypothetical protein